MFVILPIARREHKPMKRLWKKGMAAAFCKVCDSAFGTSGRRVVDGIGEEHRPLPVNGSRAGLHNTASSPASPTKETVERLSLFCQYIVAKTAKTPVFPTKTETQGLFCYLIEQLVSFQPFTPIFVDLVARLSTREKIWRVISSSGGHACVSCGKYRE